MMQNSTNDLIELSTSDFYPDFDLDRLGKVFVILHTVV
jgi:hypothetical protein